MVPSQDQFQQARQYLARVVPWPNDGAEPSFVNVHWTFQGEKFTKPAWTGRACSSVTEAASAIGFALKGENTRDVYVCMSSQREAEERTSEKGFKYRVPLRSQHNAVTLKSFFIDLDAKGEDKNSYASVEDAAAALGGFVKAIGLPKPSMVVATGGGLHVYWVVARALTIAEWRPIAFALAEATKRHGLKCDTQCTVDAARVLRVPDTFNRKTDTPRPVRIVGTPTDFDYNVERIASVLEPYKVAVPVVVASASVVEDPALFPPRKALTSDDLGAGIEQSKAPLVSLDQVATECGFVRDAITSGGKDYTNPLWNLTTLISTFTAGGRADAHRMGDKHPGYSKGSTDDLFDRKERERGVRNLGWPNCSTISGSGCKACQSCKHLPAGKSPLNYGGSHSLLQATASAVATATQQPATPAAGPRASGSTDLPKGYARRSDGVIVEVISDEDGTQNEFPIADYAMIDPWLQTGDETSILNFTTTIKGQPRNIILPVAEVGGMGMRKLLQSQDLMVPVGNKAVERVSRFYVAWIKRLQETRDTVSSSDFGWVYENGSRKGFVFGGFMWTPKGEIKSPVGDSTLARMYQPTGDIQAWKDAIKLVTDQARPDLEAIVASAFAAPLVSFTGHNGMTLAAYSQESGAGKSTALHLAQSVWGSPKRGISTLNDTYNFAMGKIGRLKALPLYWDEIKSSDQTKKFVDITFDMSLGKEKGRMQRDGGLRESGDWQTLLVVCSNDSLLQHVANNTGMTTAGLYRVFEFTVTKAKAGDPGMIDPTVATRIDAKLNQNYGNVGLEYAKFLGANHKRVDQEIADISEALSQTLKIQQDERFWVSLIAVILLGAKYANELGFAGFHIDKLREFMVRVITQMRGHRQDTHVDMREDMNVSNVFAQYWAACRAENILWTDRMWIARGKPPKNAIKAMRTYDRLKGIAIHVAVDSKLMRIGSYHLGEWLERTKKSRHIFVKALFDQFGAKKVTGRLGSGTDFAGPTEYLYEIDLNNCPKLDFIDEA